MKMVKLFSLFAAALVSALTLSACTSTASHESTGQMVDSSAITVAVKTKLAADSDISSLKISVTTFKDVVTLRGRVMTMEQKHKAVADASSVSGVRDVKDELVIAGHSHHHHHHHSSTAKTSMNDTGTTGTTTGTTDTTGTSTTTGTTGTDTTTTTTPSGQ